MLYDAEIARRDNGRLELREEPVRVRWELSDLATRDGHTVRGTFTAAVRALGEPVERQMLVETFLSSRPLVTTADVSAHFASSVHAAAAGFARDRDVDDALSPAARDVLLNRLLDAARGVAFACGLEVLPPAAIDLDSPSLRRQQVEALERQTAEQRAADQAKRLERSGELFRKFEALRTSAPHLTPGQILQRVGGPDQAELLRDLLLASARDSAARRAWAVAGPYLVGIDAEHPADAAPTLQPLPPTLGPLRSVQPADGLPDAGVLVGARSGVYAVVPARPDDVAAYHDPRTLSPLGFNAAVVWNAQVWASHTEAGLVCWNLGQMDEPARAIRPDESPVGPLAPRNLLALDADRLLFTSGSRIVCASRDGSLTNVEAGRGREILALVPEDGYVTAVHDDGRLCRLAKSDLAIVCEQTRCGRVTAAAGLPWLGSVRILLATEEGPLYCVGFDDEIVTQYASPYRGLRMVAAAANLVAATSPDRQRLILWPAWDGRKPLTEIHIAGITKHRLADVAFG